MANIELYYITPLVLGWSVMSDPPLNAYARTGHKNSIVLEYNPSDRTHPGEILHEEKSKKLVRCDIDPQYLRDYNLILAGEYSHVSNASKNVIISRAMSLSERIKVDGVLFKSKKLKKKLEEDLGIGDIDKFTDEYESLIFKTEPIYDKESIEIQ